MLLRSKHLIAHLDLSLMILFTACKSKAPENEEDIPLIIYLCMDSI